MNTINLLTIFGAGEEVQGIAALGIDPLAILAQAGTFLVLFFVIKKFALDKIFSTLEERRDKINEGVELGLEMELQKQKLEETVRSELQKTRLQADEIIATAHSEAGAVIKAAEETAARKADMVLADAHTKIEEDIVQARRNLEKDMRSLVAEATETIIREKLDAPRDMQLIDEAFQKIRSRP